MQNTFMNESKKISPPLLTRALELLPHLASVRERRFSDIRSHLGVGDASLTRLLKHLENLGWVTSPSRGRYQMGPQFEDLRTLLETSPLEGEVAEKVDALAQQAGQSCAWLIIEKGKMVCKARHSIEGSISILRKGSVLKPEFDHAAALAILSQRSREERRDHFRQLGSTIENEKHFEISIRKFQRGEVLVDLTRNRPGVSRLALPFSHRKKPSALYFCGPSVQIRQKWRWYRDLLLEAREDLKLIEG
jgi:DNA-binding IclR family transcriptional regulator